MKCNECKTQHGSARCEDCKTLFCLPCLTQHHSELLAKFQQQMDERNRIKQLLQIKLSKNEQDKNSTSFVQINQWETEMIQQIRIIAAAKRKEIENIVENEFSQLNASIEKLTSEMEQKQKDGIYLENDLKEMKNRLEKVRNEIEGSNSTIDVTISKNIDWASMIQIINRKKDLSFSSSTFPSKKYSTTSKNPIPDKPRYRHENSVEYDDDDQW